MKKPITPRQWLVRRGYRIEKDIECSDDWFAPEGHCVGPYEWLKLMHEYAEYVCSK